MSCRWLPIAFLLFFPGADSWAYEPAYLEAPFKSLADMPGTIVLAKCSPGPSEMVVCETRETWRGRAPTSEIRIRQRDWGAYPIGGMERQTDVLFLLILGEHDAPVCMGDSTFFAWSTCVVPVVAGKLPKSFRPSYDATHGDELTVEQLKSQLLAKRPQP